SCAKNRGPSCRWGCDMASLLTRIETFLLALSGRKQTEPELKSRLALTILLSAFGLVLIVVFSVIQALGGLWWVAATNQISTLFFVVILALLRRRHGYAARV